MQHIDILIIKYLNDKLRPEESLKLTQWVQESKENESYYKRFIHHEYLLLHSVTPQPKNLKTRKDLDLKKPNKSYLKWSAIAAVFIGLITIASILFLLPSKDLKVQEPTFRIDNVVLELEDGSTTDINQLESIANIKNDHIQVDRKNKQIAYQPDQKLTDNKLIFHKIIVPPGRKYKVKLSDGTIVYLNSASSLKYPKQFSGHTPRQVFLEGEAYFEVSHDSIHPFLVRTGPLTIKVLGTTFNHRSYPTDSLAKTTLTQGKVAVWKTKDSTQTYILKPAEAILYNRKQNTMSKKATDISLDLAWMDNRLVFKKEPFSVIAKRIQRSYGVKITNQFNALNQIRFSGEFNLTQESITDVLNTFKLSTPFSYHITDNEIFITKNQ